MCLMYTIPLILSDVVRHVHDVPLDGVLDVFGSIGVEKSISGFLKVLGGRRDVGNHHSHGIPTQRVLQQPSQLGIPGENLDAGFVEGRLGIYADKYSHH